MIPQLKDVPIRVKIVGTFTAILLLISVFNMVYFPASEKDQVNRALQDRASSVVQMLAAGITTALDEGDYHLVNQLFEMVRADPGILFVLVVDEAGDSIISFNPSELEVPAQQDFSGRDMLETGGILHSSALVQIEEGTEGTLIMGWSLEERDEQLARIRITGVVVSVAIFMAGVVLLSVLSRLITEPMQKLVAATEEIAETGAFDRVIDNESEDEVGVLVGAFNTMVARQRQAETDKQQRMRELEQQINSRQRAEAEQARLEDQLRQSQKLEAIGQLTTGIAHNFNNLLMVIAGSVELARNIPKESAQHLENAVEAADKAAGMIRQLMLFSRNVGVARNPLDLRPIVDDIVRMCRDTFDRKISIVAEMSDDVPNVSGDSGQIEQMIFNLFINARDAVEAVSDRPPAITLHLNDVKIGLEDCAGHVDMRPGHFVRIAVSDNGVGMDEETTRRIFEPFFTTKEFARGTGLGLSTVYGIVKQHSGGIEVASKPGVGTTFEVYLPVAENVTAAEPEAIGEPMRGGSETILVIDDEEMVRTTLVSMLEAHGYTVLVGTDGKNGLSVFRAEQSRIEVVVLDLIMPGMSGYEVLVELRNMECDAKIIICTGVQPDRTALAGVHAIVQKPVRLPKVLLTVRRVLGSISP